MLEFRPARLEDAAICTRYISKSSEAFLDAVFTLGKISFQDFIQFDFEQGQGIFGFKHLYLAQNQAQILGVLTLYQGKKFNQLAKHSLISIFKFYGFFQALIILKRTIALRTLFDAPSSDCVFIANGYVDEGHRIPGVFSGLVDYAIQFAEEKGLKALECDVSFRNERSFKVHEFLGFEIMKRNPYNGSNKKFDGFTRLRLSLED